MKINNEPSTVKALRLEAGLTQKECSLIYGVGIRTWQKKEEENTQNSQKLSKVEFEYLLLLAGEHPDYVLNKRNNSSNTPSENKIA
ncbi:XRE family transcriptional regulator [Escherichia coli]|nr:XRE family transcriptional regulator [Escherichia coli]MGE31034.1 XRE family transcriptional regulator [Escherichia coli]HDL8517147.1 XRE family transcriptional regulator [Yersinia enterocolitica]HDL8557845.1 XRE family transcriptional regulator [Yersinia enterocolitica]